MECLERRHLGMLETPADFRALTRVQITTEQSVIHTKQSENGWGQGQNNQEEGILVQAEGDDILHHMTKQISAQLFIRGKVLLLVPEDSKSVRNACLANARVSDGITQSSRLRVAHAVEGLKCPA